MAPTTALRPAVRAARFLRSATRPSLSSRLPGRQNTPRVPFACVHTTSPKPQEAAAALRQTDVPRPAEPSSVNDLGRSSSPPPPPRALRYETPALEDPRLLRIVDAGTGEPAAVFDAAWLRDRCPCPRCVSPSSGNKSFATTEIPPDIAFAEVRALPDGAVEVRWANDIPRAAAAGHVSVFPAAGEDALAAMALERPVLFARHHWPPDRAPKFLWTAETLAPRLLRIRYDDFVGGGAPFRDAVLSLSRVGIVFLTDVPQTETAVADVALAFGAVKETFYGRTWDVVSKPEAENVAYTSSYLGLHSDLLYLDSPPRVQLLHCLENSCSGGESIFSDALRAAALLRDARPDGYDALCSFPVPYHYARNGFFYRQARPVVAHAEDPGLAEVWWSPPFQAPFPAHETEAQAAAWPRWLDAARAFQAVLEDPANVYQYKLRPGECVLFDNRRVLHGRRAFDTGSGRRWLKGTYVADEDLRSTLRRVQGAGN
ncbi:TfdA family taurine catabolism dioxygenase TauD [Colletotrichum falcatum]|nr:TfdA family taurine catabolism dioxygenase TauD [Colletotrichum falcatum]